VHADFTKEDRQLLGRWLQYRDHEGRLVGFRSFFMEMFFEPFAPDDVKGWLLWLERIVEELRGQPSTLAHLPPLGRDAGSLSSWEHAWLFAEDVRQRGELGSPVQALQRLKEHGHTSREPFDTVLLLVMCLESVDDALHFVDALADHDDLELWVTGTYPAAIEMDRKAAPVIQGWVRWLAGRAAPPAKVVSPSYLPWRAVERALEGRWEDAEQELLPALRRVFGRALRDGPPRLVMPKFTAQLVSHALHGKPQRNILDRSLGALFSFWGLKTRDPPFYGTDIETRLPLVALHAKLCDLDEPGAVLLHRLRRFNDHLTSPVGATFVTPPEVLERAEAFLALFRFAAENDRALFRDTLDGSGVRFRAVQV
jgi:hypothetical protein